MCSILLFQTNPSDSLYSLHVVFNFRGRLLLMRAGNSGVIREVRRPTQVNQKPLPSSRAVLLSDFVSQHAAEPSLRKAGKESKPTPSKPAVVELSKERQGPGIKRAADDNAAAVDMEGGQPRKWQLNATFVTMSVRATASTTRWPGHVLMGRRDTNAKSADGFKACSMKMTSA